MKISKRKLLAFGGAGILIGGGTGAHGAEVDPTMPGFTVKICKYRGVWSIAVPDWSASDWSEQHQLNVNMSSHFCPIKWIPLTEFTDIMDNDV